MADIPEWVKVGTEMIEVPHSWSRLPPPYPKVG